jgi:hypothetical protein
MKTLILAFCMFSLLSAACDNQDRDDVLNGVDTNNQNDEQTVNDEQSQDDDEQVLKDEEQSAEDDVQIPDGNNTPVPVTMSLSVTTATYNGQYAPRNVFAVWIEKEDGSYIQTLGAWAQSYKSKLQRWASKSNYGSNGMVDAITGASRMNHNPVPELTWKIDDITFQPAQNGIYNVYFELNETNFGSISTTAKIQISETPQVIQINNIDNIKDIQISF